MSDWNNLEDEEEDKTISLDDLETMEKDKARESSSSQDQDDWGDSYDDMDSEVWDSQSRKDDEELDVDPWDLG